MKPAYDLKHVKSVRAVALLFDGKPAGKVVANYSDGGTCTGPLGEMPSTTGTAGGHGYDKLAGAVLRCASSR